MVIYCFGYPWGRRWNKHYIELTQEKNYPSKPLFLCPFLIAVCFTWTRSVSYSAVIWRYSNLRIILLSREKLPFNGQEKRGMYYSEVSCHRYLWSGVCPHLITVPCRIESTNAKISPTVSCTSNFFLHDINIIQKIS